MFASGHRQIKLVTLDIFKNGVAKIKRNSKIFYIIFGAIDVFLLLMTVFLLAASLLFRGNSAPSVFGHNVFLTDSDAFSTVKKGSALIVDKVEPEEITAGNIIIFTDEEEHNRIGEVQEVMSDGGIYTFTVKNDIGGSVAVGQSHIVGKGVYYSEIIGGLISFATSPTGVCLIAILPCAAFVIFEVIGIIKRRAPQPEVDTVKKQYETPTYIPPSSQSKPADQPEEEKPAFSNERQKLVEAAGLFTQPAKKPEPPKAEERAPISGRAIDQLIKETKAKHEREAFAAGDIPSRPSPAPKPQTDLAQSGRQAVAAAAYRAAVAAEERPGIELTSEDEKPHDIPMETEKPEKREESVRQYVPSKRPTVRLSPRVSRLDSLLREESGEAEYDVDDILRSLESKGNTTPR